MTIYLHNENFTAKAIDYLNQAIALSPRSADLYNMRGIAYSKLGDGDRADVDFRKVTELAPRAAEAHMNRGVDFMMQGDRNTPSPLPIAPGEDILGVELEKLAAQLDQEWLRRNGESWTRHRAEYLERRATLDRLATLETPTAGELFKWAEVLEILEGSDEALCVSRSMGRPHERLSDALKLLSGSDSNYALESTVWHR
jgi:tetratricopeptide (TPR) repeat protein